MACKYRLRACKLRRMDFPAAIQTAVLLVGAWRCRRFPVFLIALEVSLPPLWRPASAFWPHMDWERFVWLPCALLLVPAQAIAALEAAFRFGERYWLAPTITGTLAVGAAAISIARYGTWPHGSLAAEVMQVARVQRVGCAMFLVAAVVLYAIVRWRGLVSRVDGAHLILLAAMSVPSAVIAVAPTPKEWGTWLTIDWPVTAKTALLVAWVLLVALRQPRQDRLYLLNAPVNPIDFIGK